MNCLVVGGTGFLGGAIARALMKDGHHVTVLSRGKVASSAAKGTMAIFADRHDGLDVLGDLRFDWVFDTCAYAPDAVETLINSLHKSIGRYVIISSVSAYGIFSHPARSEEEDVPDATANDIAYAASLSCEMRATASAYGASYGRLKRACEIRAMDLLGSRATALRAGLLVGVGDYSDRMTWWVRRIDQAHGPREDVPAPLPKDRKVQFIDVRDMAGFALGAAAQDLPGVWNVTGQPQTLHSLLATIKSVCRSKARFRWVTENAMEKEGVEPWSDIPLMAPMQPEFRYFLEVSTTKAIDAGLACRPVAQTIQALLDWDRGRRDQPLVCGLSDQQEAALMAIV